MFSDGRSAEFGGLGGDLSQKTGDIVELALSITGSFEKLAQFVKTFHPRLAFWDPQNLVQLCQVAGRLLQRLEIGQARIPPKLRPMSPQLSIGTRSLSAHHLAWNSGARTFQPQPQCNELGGCVSNSLAQIRAEGRRDDIRLDDHVGDRLKLPFD